MNEQSWQSSASLVDGGPAWLTLSFVLIALGVVAALVVLLWGARLARRRANAEHELDDRGELHRIGTPPVMSPPSEPPSPPADEPAPRSPIADEPIAAAASLDASPAALAASEPGAEPERAPAAGADDLTRMKGVGPKLAQRLNSVGIMRFDQLASLTPAEAEALDAQLGDFRGRIHRDRWIEQAGFLARGDTAGYEANFGRL